MLVYVWNKTDATGDSRKPPGVINRLHCGTDAMRHTQLIAPALYGNSHNKYSFVICRSYGDFFPICRANGSQKSKAEINNQYITNISPNPDKHVLSVSVDTVSYEEGKK